MEIVSEDAEREAIKLQFLLHRAAPFSTTLAGKCQAVLIQGCMPLHCAFSFLPTATTTTTILHPACDNSPDIFPQQPGKKEKDIKQQSTSECTVLG